MPPPGRQNSTKAGMLSQSGSGAKISAAITARVAAVERHRDLDRQPQDLAQGHDQSSPSAAAQMPDDTSARSTSDTGFAAVPRSCRTASEMLFMPWI